MRFTNLLLTKGSIGDWEDSDAFLAGPEKTRLINADGLIPDSDMSDLDPAMRGMFSANSNCTRHYTISLAGGLVFNYAVDAS